jgi:hypothetical protein
MKIDEWQINIRKYVPYNMSLGKGTLQREITIALLEQSKSRTPTMQDTVKDMERQELSLLV